MYVEWWMAVVILVWWFASIAQITSSIRRTSFADGVTQGTESTLKVLEKQGIIRMNGEIIEPGEKS
jgi:hypothetical protein